MPGYSVRVDHGIERVAVMGRVAESVKVEGALEDVDRACRSGPLLTGWPAGVGMPHERFLRVGDMVRSWVERIGEMLHRMLDFEFDEQSY